MNPNNLFADLPADEREELARLVETAGSLRPDESFIKRTEMQLKDAFAVKKEKTMKRFNLVWQILAGTAAIAALALGTIWLVRSVAPEPQNPSVPVNPSFVCPVTQPNGSLPPGEANNSPYYLGNGQLWTDLWPDGKVVMNEVDNREPDGSLSMKWGWWRGVSGSLSIEGRRLDAEAGPLRSLITSGYGDNGLQITALIFPTTGCWEVTGYVGDASLTFVTEVVLAGTAPVPQPTAILQPSATPVAATYNWHGTKITFATEFPQTPAEAGIYTYSTPAAATIESARKLAERFGLQGDVYLDASNFASTTSYLVTDGKQRVSISSNGMFSYYTDYSKAFVEAPGSLATASGAIDAFLKAHDFNFDYRLEPAKGIGTDWFYVIPLTLAGQQIRFDFGLMQRMAIHVGSDGQIINLDAYLLNPDAQPIGQFGLISAKDAWQKFLNDASPGILQSSHGSGSERLLWHRTYPDNQPVTLYGNVQSFAPAEAGKSPFVSVDGFTANGKTAGMENLAYNTFVQAQGQFFSENGIRKFEVDTWQVFDQTNQQFLEGNLRRQDGNVIFSSQGVDYTLPDVPADLPIPLEKISLSGIAKGTQLDWQDLLYFKNPNQGGGGGCGGSFARLNLSGTPVLWPTPSPVAASSELPIGQYIEGKRGTLSVNLYEQKDGSQRTEYNFFSPGGQYILEGQGLEQLKNNHNRPVVIWGTVTGYNEYQLPVVTVERFEIPYPDLKFQILRGIQKQITVDGQQVTLFTSGDGKSYAQLMPAGIPDNNLVGVEGDLVEYEVLIIPDETFGGYPTMRVFSGGMVTDQPMTVTADQPYALPEPVQSSGPAPTLTIDSIELVYYTPNPQYASSYPDAMSPYIQPVWRFSGHYSDGPETEILIQALKPDFLLPEAAPALQCG